MLNTEEFEILKSEIEKSNLFDKVFYLKTYQDVRVSDMSAIDHFVKHGLKENRKPNAEFDPSWYKEFYADVKESDTNPTIHYLQYGKDENRFQNEKELTLEIEKPEQVKQQEQQIVNTSKFGAIYHNPLVSIISVNYNGSNDLPDFLKSVSNQSYKNFELIIIDNNSRDNSEEIVNEYKHLFKTIKFIQSGQNLGFAAGNNYALPYCHGELIALLNIDTVVDKEWLKELVDAISVDGESAAVASKTLFFERFQDIEINYNDKFTLNLDGTIDSLTYKKYFVRYGNLIDNKIESIDNKIIISLPIQNEKLKLSFNQETPSKSNLIYKVGKNKPQSIEFNKNNIAFELDYTQEDMVNSSYIINNAGSFTKDGMPADRGFGEYDNGQYDSKCYVDFVCGVSVLLRRSAIVDRKIFVSEFFAYYEDSELSRWINEQGYKILYAPRSVLYHQHSATSSEGSPLWSLLVTRSRNIYQYNGDYVELFNTNNHFEEYFKPNVHEAVYKELKSFSKQLKDRLAQENTIVEKLKPIAIYNSYWDTKGGGESHALAFATVLQKYETVYLVSENNFDIDELAEYYDIDLSNCRKLLESQINTEFTKKFDIFINSTYKSNLISQASRSYYIVSFPDRYADENILPAYTFLYNSDYTKRWAHKYWGENLKEDIIYPLGMINNKEIDLNTLHKEKVILSVGRFFVGEHSKNQHIIAEAYKNLVSQDGSLKDWKLVLIGSLNNQSREDVEYVNKIKEILSGLNYELILNAERKVLNQFFQKAHIYVHASGYGNDAENEPNKFEHFGITPVEAMVNGCLPIVYEIGGPAELTKKLNLGERYKTIENLVTNMYNKINQFDKISHGDIIRKVNEFIESENINQRVKNIYKRENHV
jgi:GT2 family glycosyltransferase